MTIEAVRERRKTVTRRHVDTWQKLAVGDRLTLVEKGMGLPKGASQVVLAEVEIVNVRVESIGMVTFEKRAMQREGLPNMTTSEFIAFWLNGHGYRNGDATTPCRRIEWRYVL